MPFEQYKTQVLLLHSQQTTLDRLRTGFTDDYSVHCATSGTEALNTLGDTPIHVIVSAQDLPGMSGLDALREAKKRSPDTIAILLAGTDAGDGLEAMVSDKEVFQIVRGEIAPDALKNLIDSATKSVRLLALSEASNDKAANVDEPYQTGEHIVMETAENGSVIISDGTGTVPVLRPDKIQVAANAGGHAVDVLVLTKDEEFLGTVKESSRGMHNVHHAVTPRQAEDIARSHTVGILVTDAAMVGSNIEALSQRLRASSPRLVAIVAGRRDDGELLMDLINRGHVYRFLLKPVSPGRARLAIEASVKHHLEAADSAFTDKPRAKAPPTGATATNPVLTPKPAAPTKSGAVPAQKPQPAAPAARSAKTASPSKRPPAAAARSDSSTKNPTMSNPALKATAGPQPVPAKLDDAFKDGLDDAFEETNSFTETMTGIAVSFGKTLSGAAESIKNKHSEKKKQKEQAKKAQQAAATTPVAPVKGPELAPVPPPSKPAAQPTPAPAAREPKKKAPDAAPTPVTPAPAQNRPEPELPKPVTAVPIDTPAPAAPPISAPVSPIRPAAQKPSGGDGGSLFAKPTVIALIAGVVLFSVLSLWMFSGDDDLPAADLPQVASPAPDLPAQEAMDDARPIDPPPASPVASEVSEPVSGNTSGLLADARAARERGDVYAPAGRNAVEFLIAARDQSPGDTAIAAELDDLVADVFGMAESALLDNRSTDASRALRVIELADPENGRLAFLNAQLGQQQLRSFLDDARSAIRQGNFEDAGRLLAQAESTAGGSNAEIDALSAELAAARSSQRIDDVLALAGQRLTEDRLVSPPNDNARYYYQLAQTSEPGNIAAQQGLVAVASKLVLRARSAIDSADYDDADRLLSDARSLDPRNSELAAAADALENARNQRTSQDRIAAEQQREAERLAAEREAVAQREAEADRRAAEQAEQERLAAERQAAANAAAERAEQEASARPAVAAASVSAPSTPVAISTLERTRYVPPRFPRLAQRRNATGHVDLAFTVTTEGKVTDVDVTDSEPGTLFDDAAVEAVEQWEFAPPVENGSPVEKRVAVRMSFALQ